MEDWGASWGESMIEYVAAAAVLYAFLAKGKQSSTAPAGSTATPAIGSIPSQGSTSGTSLLGSLLGGGGGGNPATPTSMSFPTDPHANPAPSYKAGPAPTPVHTTAPAPARVVPPVVTTPVSPARATPIMPALKPLSFGAEKAPLPKVSTRLNS